MMWILNERDRNFILDIIFFNRKFSFSSISVKKHTRDIVLQILFSSKGK